MAKKKKSKKSASSLDNLQYKPIMIALFAGMFLGMQASSIDTVTMFAIGAIAGVSSSVGFYALVLSKSKKEPSE